MRTQISSCMLTANHQSVYCCDALDIKLGLFDVDKNVYLDDGVSFITLKLFSRVSGNDAVAFVGLNVCL